ncbi:MAG: hypothetical protein IMZ74_03725 [Actinobacteria bacterium]|nr:hypothetical protein [Actinomycetota bacterium]
MLRQGGTVSQMHDFAVDGAGNTVVALWGSDSLFSDGVMGTTAGYDDILAAKYVR